MGNCTLIYDDVFLLHKPPFNHPERPERLQAILKLLKEESFLDTLEILPPAEASKEQILAVHSPEHYSYVKNSIAQGRTLLDSGDTFIVKDSWLASLLAAGSAASAVDIVMSGKSKNVFCLIRPPGHHATTAQSMGFCIFNNAAIGARYAIDKYNLERIAIIDWDVHHGNGTQEIFYDSSKVYYFSLHQYPFYPGTGSEVEKGIGDGFGHTLNFPLPARTDGKVYLNIFEKRILRELEKYSPQLLFISAGFDAHKNDPLAEMRLEEKDFAGMTSFLKDYASGKMIPIISLLEGGYNLEALSKSVYEHLKVLAA